MLLNYFIDNINTYYHLVNNNIIDNFKNLNLNDSPHINLYGHNSSLKNFYLYHIINILTKDNFKINLLKLHKYSINVNNNNIDFNVKIYPSFQELNLTYKSNYDKHIITKYASLEKGVRNLKRCLEDILMKINLIRFVKNEDESQKSQIKFPYNINKIGFKFPLTLDNDIIDELLKTSFKKSELPMSIQKMYL